MSVVIEFSIRTNRFVLGDFIDRYEGLEAEFDRLVPTAERSVPYVWVTGPAESLDALTESLDSSDVTESVRVLDDISLANSNKHRRLYRIDWSPEELHLLQAIIDAEGSIVEARSADHYWRLRIRFDDHHHVAEFYEFLADTGVTDFSIDNIHELEQQLDPGFDSLTTEQREALIYAFEHGYFDSPRGISLEAIGEEFGISQQAASDRIRRATQSVVAEALNIPPERHPETPDSP